MVANASLAEALFQLAESHPAGELRLALLRAAYAVFDHPRELASARRLPESVPLEALPTVAMLRSTRGPDAVAAAVQRLLGPLPLRNDHVRSGYLTAAEVANALRAPRALPTATLRGTVHWHTRASDGAATLDAMARACARRGASWAVVADHSRGLACVNGLDGEGVALQRRAIAAWNRRHGEELSLLQGIEVEILDDGRLDLPRAARGDLLVIAAVHSSLGEKRDQTLRYLRALDEPNVWALAHPRGRLFSQRSGVRANWEVVFRRAASAGVLVEINGFPRRQDPDPVMLSLASACGCRFVLASDAHHPRHLEFDATAAAMATMARIPAARIVNYLPLDAILDMDAPGAV